jgi:hypothetical protein
VHEMKIDRYSQLDPEGWRVVCLQCGLAIDNLELDQAGRVADVMERRMCGTVVGGGGQGCAVPRGVGAFPTADDQVLAAWTGPLEPS